MNKRLSVAGLVLLLVLSAMAAEAGTETRKSQFEYYPETGLLKKEIIEPEKPQLCLVTEYEYDDFGNKKRANTRNCNGSSGEASTPLAGTDGVIAPRETNSEYDPPAALIKRGQFPVKVTNALNQSENRTYDPKFGRIATLTGPNGLRTIWAYDGFGRKVSEGRADGTGTVWTYLTGNQNGPQNTNVKYTIKTQTKDPLGNINAGMDVYDYYDLLGRKLLSSRRNFTAENWIDEGRVEYDNIGRIKSSYLPHDRGTFSAAGTPHATTQFDLLNRPIKQIAADLSVIRYEYAGLNQSVYQAPSEADIGTIKELKIKTTTSNVLGQTVKIVDALNGILTYTYDAFGNLQTTTDAAGNVTTLEYDIRGRKTKMVDPDMGTWFYYYNALGELIRQVDSKKDAQNPNGQAVYMTYDLLGRMLTRSEPDLKSRWEYDKLIDRNGRVEANGKGVGKLAMALSTNGYRRSHTYDDLGRLIKTETIIGGTVVNRISPGTGKYVNGTPQVTQVHYDGFGRVDVQTYPTGFAVMNVYNPAGYLTDVKNADPASSEVYWTANSMDAAGHVLRQTYGGNGVVVDQGFYPTTGRLDTQTASYSSLSGTTIDLQNMKYEYDTLGNLKTRNDNINGAHEIFTYDDLNRLKSASIDNISTPSGLSAVSYIEYDAIGNITSKTTLTTAQDGSQTLSDAGNYTYNASGPNSIRPHAVAGITQATADVGVTNTTGMLNGRVNPTFTYDANGNMLTGAGRTIDWSSFNMPNWIENCPPGGGACKRTSFVYNPEHERTTEYQADGSTVHVLSPRYDTGLHFEKRFKTDGSIEYEHYLYAGGLMFGKYVTHTNAAGTAIKTKDLAGTLRYRVIEYYLKDHLGSITALVNGDANPALKPDGTANPEAGKYAVRYLSYDVWGKKRNPDGVPDPNGALNNPDMYHGFTGHEMLDEVGLIHMNGRLYDPVLARFVSADFLIEDPGNLQSYNRYSYVWNNPLGYSDPSGFSRWTRFRDNILKPGLAIAVSVFAPEISAAIGWTGVSGGLSASIGISSSAVASGMLGGAMAGAIMGGTLESAVTGGISGGMFGWAGGVGAPTDIARYGAHALAGCASGVLGGGGCGQGALSAVAGKWATNATDGNFIASVVAGGTVSVIGGGKFANGAVTAAYGYFFNYCSNSGKCTTAFEQAMYDYWPGYKYGTCLSNGGCTASELVGTSADMVLGVVGGIEGKGVKAALYADPKLAARLEVQLSTDGMKSIHRSLASMESRLSEHVQKLDSLQYKSSVEREIRTFTKQIDTIKQFIKNNGI